MVNTRIKKVYNRINADFAAHKYLPTLENNLKTPRGDPGWLCTFFAHDENGEISHPVQQFILNDTRVKLNDFLPKGLTDTWSIKLEGKLTFDKTAPYELGLTVAGSIIITFLPRIRISTNTDFCRQSQIVDRWRTHHRQLDEANTRRFLLWVRESSLLLNSVLE